MSNTYYKLINTFFVVTPMTLCMAIIAIYRGNGFRDDWVTIFFKSWLTMLPVAYGIAFLILPTAKKITDRLMRRINKLSSSSASKR